jgi:hypothetical protein
MSEPLVSTAPLSRPSSDRPTPASSLLFAAKVLLLQARRIALDLLAAPTLLKAAPATGFTETAALSRTLLWSDTAPGEHALQLGKVENLRVACRALDGLLIPAGTTFSFWRQVGPPGMVRGFVPGRMIQQGCLLPVVGGGLCQLSNALYDVALQAGCRIVERHAHSRIVPGSTAAEGRDATVAWNYVDLRFAPDRDLRLSARLERDTLEVRLLARDGGFVTAPVKVRRAPALLRAAESCFTCDETACFRHGGDTTTADVEERTAYLVDEAWPEFRRHVHTARRPEDRLGRPLDSRLVRAARYGWSAEGFDRRFDASLQTLHRSLALRGAAQGPVRRRVELLSAERMAEALALRLTPDVTRLVVAQSYLPHLWRTGRLGGRQVEVLMTRLPAAVLQQRLDAAFARHPERATLADFRADPTFVEAEAQALAHATRIITPHAAIAALFPTRAVLLPWERPETPATPLSTGPIRRIAFPGPTVARKGAHTVREAARVLDLEVMLMGSELEGPGFWDGVRTAPFTGWDGVDAVVQPAVIEDQPRRLLAALHAGVPVFATAACGLGQRPGATLIGDDAAELIEALAAR